MMDTYIRTNISSLPHSAIRVIGPVVKNVCPLKPEIYMSPNFKRHDLTPLQKKCFLTGVLAQSRLLRCSIENAEGSV